MPIRKASWQVGAVDMLCKRKLQKQVLVVLH